MQFESPRLRGIREHLERVRFLVDLARDQKHADSAYRLRLAAVYSCRAVADLTLEAAEKQELKDITDADPQVRRKRLEDDIRPQLPFYTLVEIIRIHDFHRFGIPPPNPAVREVFVGGPVKVTAQKGSVAVTLDSKGLDVQSAGNSHTKTQRPLVNADGAFWDEQTSQYMTLDAILDMFLSKADDVMGAFEKRLT